MFKKYIMEARICWEFKPFVDGYQYFIPGGDEG